MWKKLIIAALAVATCVVWYLIVRDHNISSNSFGEAEAEQIGREYGAERTGWKQVKVDVSGVHGGHWNVVVSKIPPQPGGRFSLELDENGKIINSDGGSETTSGTQK